MVTASLTPMMTPASKGPSALPRPPSITAANTTPTQAKICDGVSVKVRARQMPAAPASAAQVPASTRLRARSFTPKAAAIGPSSAIARSALPRSV